MVMGTCTLTRQYIRPLVASSIGVVRTVCVLLCRNPRSLYLVVVEDSLFELGCYLSVVAEGRALLDRILVRLDLDKLSFIVYTHNIHRDQGRAGAKKTHPYAYILWPFALVEE